MNVSRKALLCSKKRKKMKKRKTPSKSLSVGGDPSGLTTRRRGEKKNRISARDSRKRKKEYIETLEMKLAVVEGERNRLLRVVETMQEREKIRSVSHMETLDQILTGRQQLYDRLEESVEK